MNEKSLSILLHVSSRSFSRASLVFSLSCYSLWISSLSFWWKSSIIRKSLFCVSSLILNVLEVVKGWYTFYSIESFSWNELSSSSSFYISIWELSSRYFFSSSMISWMISSFSIISFDFDSVCSSKFLLCLSILVFISLT